MPDVETFKRVLARSALRKTIERVVVNDKRILGELAAQTFISRLQGASFVAARRYGKHLLASIDRGGWLHSTSSRSRTPNRPSHACASISPMTALLLTPTKG